MIDAKYIATFEVAKKIIWFRKFMIELGLVSSINNIVMYYNNGLVV